MKVSNMGQTITIEAKKNYTTDELFELCKAEGNWGGAELQMKKFLGFKSIVFPGAKGWDNLVSCSKSTITMAQQKSSGAGILKSLLIDSVTDGLGGIFNVEGRSNAQIMEDIAKEIERLVG